MRPNKVLVVRHGESTWNVLRSQCFTQEADRYLPVMFTPDAPMTERGIAQSRQAGIELSLHTAEEKAGEYVMVVSPLRRALQTTHHLLQTVATESHPGLSRSDRSHAGCVRQCSIDRGPTPKGVSGV